MLRTAVRMVRSTLMALRQRNQAAVQFAHLAQAGSLTSAQVDGYVNVSDSPEVQAARNWLGDQILAHVPATGSVLDAGCGTGYYLELVAHANPGLGLYGVDLSEPTLRLYTRARVPHAQLAVGDFSRTVPFEGRAFELVYCITVLQYVHPIFLRAALRNLASSLARGGTLLVAMPAGVDWQDTWKMRGYFRHTDAALCAAIEAAGLEVCGQQRAPQALAQGGARRDLVIVAKHSGLPATPPKD